MHVLISWDISSENKPEWDELNGKLRECLKGFSWVKPVANVYIVRIDSAEKRKAIHESMVSVCRQHSKEIDLLISPIIDGTQYTGWLPGAMWEKIGKRTKGDYHEE